MNQRVAFVTGSGRGIGQAVAVRLAKRGVRVAVADLRDELAAETVALITAGGGTAIPVSVDVTDGASVETAVRVAAAQLGTVDILINNAGWDELHQFLDTDEDFWERVVQINYLGTVRTSKAVLPGMVKAGWGRIVNIGSDAGRVGSSLEAVYSGAKGGVIAFTKTVAREVGRSGITANTVCPGPTETPLLAEQLGSDDTTGRVVEGLKRSIPLGRLGRPEDVAVAVDFFASEDACFVTGQTLSVSGGLTMA